MNFFVCLIVRTYVRYFSLKILLVVLILCIVYIICWKYCHFYDEVSFRIFLLNFKQDEQLKNSSFHNVTVLHFLKWGDL